MNTSLIAKMPFFSFCFCVGIAYLLNCSMQSSLTNGGTTEITNARVSGFVFMHTNQDPLDTIRIAYAEAILHSRNGLSKSCLCDSIGRFTFSKLDTGSYHLEVMSGDSVGALTTISIDKLQKVSEIPIRVLKVGGIKGFVQKTSDIGKIDTTFKNTFVLIQEIGKRVPVDSNGAFFFTRIPPYDSYTLYIFNQKNSMISESRTIAVKEAKITQTQNTPPVILSTQTTMKSSASILSLYCDTISAFDQDKDSLFYKFLEFPTGMELKDSIISWIPVKKMCMMQPQVQVSVEVSDHKSGADTLVWTINVQCNPY